MLYVFHVDAGYMATYDMSLTLQTVAILKQAIEKRTKIPVSSVVLLISGGEMLLDDHIVSSYSAGTDTNPIYMFSILSLSVDVSRQSSQTYSVSDLSPIVDLTVDHWRSETRDVAMKSVEELTAAVDKCCSLPPSVPTVVNCANLAQQFSELAHDLTRTAEQLVHDQHLQFQGWSAVVANLEDIFNEFCERTKTFKETYKTHRAKRDEYHRQVDALNDVLTNLGRVPIPPALRNNAEAHRFSAFDVFEEQYESRQAASDHSSERAAADFGVEPFRMPEEDVFEPTDQQCEVRPVDESDEGLTFSAPPQEAREERPTLRNWILAQGNKAALQDILDYCNKGMGLIDADPLKQRENELRRILQDANTIGLKQIRGIEERLYGLNQLLTESRKLERDQHDQAASLIQNRERVSTSCDPSVLPTLVQSHRCQLEQLLKNHCMLVDIRRRIAKSKEELSNIIKFRLERVLKVENSMSVYDAHQMLNFQCFTRLERYFAIVQQLDNAPAVFVHAVYEVARRRRFSDHFLKWSSDLAESLLQIHDEEVKRRREFNDLFEGHFLRSLFPGMVEMPPPFATQRPAVFDDKLPRLTRADVEFVLQCFPELGASVPRHDMDAPVRFFSRRIRISECADKDADVPRDLDDIASPQSDGGRRSAAAAQRVDSATSCCPSTAESATETEETMETEQRRIEQMIGLFNTLYRLCQSRVVAIRQELAALRTDIGAEQEFMRGSCKELLGAWEQSVEDNALQLREQTQRLTVDHELELTDLKNDLRVRDDTIDALQTEKEALIATHRSEIERLRAEHALTKEMQEKCREEISQFEARLQEIEAQKQRDLKEQQEKLHLEYKAEIESLRSRFRLVALTNNMDRSPSESSLEKIERTDVIEISSHNAIVMQTKENAEAEREAAVREAVAACEAEWRRRWDDELAGLRTKCEHEKQTTINDVARRLLAEKDRQLELVREREAARGRECAKYRETIQQLTDPETNDYDSLLRPQLAALESEKALLETQVQELKKELEKRDEADKSREETDKSKEETDKSKEDDSDGRSSRRRRRRCHTPYGLAAGTLALSACLPGQHVLVMWDPAHHNYTVMQEAAIMYFVNSECLPALDLSINVRSEAERRLYTVATVESKEYCYARKSGNRFHVPRGSRFYRVRVKPYSVSLPPPPCCDARHKDNQRPSTSEAPEVATARLIDLESPRGDPSDPADPADPADPEEQPDSIESNEWGSARMLASTGVVTDMEASVAVALQPEPPEPPEAGGDSELAEEAAP